MIPEQGPRKTPLSHPSSDRSRGKRKLSSGQLDLVPLVKETNAGSPERCSKDRVVWRSKAHRTHGKAMAEVRQLRAHPLSPQWVGFQKPTGEYHWRLQRCCLAEDLWESDKALGAGMPL